jgi:hypothetical protein
MRLFFFAADAAESVDPEIERIYMPLIRGLKLYFGIRPPHNQNL